MCKWNFFIQSLRKSCDILSYMVIWYTLSEKKECINIQLKKCQIQLSVK